MKTTVVRIGNSRGIRLPKAILKECRLEGEVELEVKKGRLIVWPAAKPRRGWGEAFRRMALKGDDVLLDRPGWPQTRWDKSE